jgi:hypothetical protein
MRRILLVTSVTVVVLTTSACPPDSQTFPCGEPESIDLSQCDLASLTSVQPGGIWNTDVQWTGGAFILGAMNLLDPMNETIGNQPVTHKVVEGNTYFLATSYEREGRTYKLAYSGCGATSPTHFGGIVQFCSAGTSTARGLFKAGRLARRTGEAESSRLTLVSELQLSTGTAQDVFVSNGYAYVSALSAGLEIVDVRDPAHPVSIAKITPEEDYWNSALVKDGVLYIASASAGLIYYDVTNPAAPVKLGAVPSDKPHLHNFFLDGNRLFATSPFPNGEVIVFDVTNVREPAVTARFKSPDTDPSAGLWPSSVAALGNTMYIAHRALGYVIAELGSAGGTGPKELGQFQYPGILTSQATVVTTIGDKTIAFEAGEDWDAHLRVLDVTNPKSISKIGELKGRPEVSIHNFVLSGTKLYMTHYQDGVRIIDVSDPTAPKEIGYFNTWRETDPGRGKSFFEGAVGIRVPGDGHIYVTETSRGLMIFDEL